MGRLLAVGHSWLQVEKGGDVTRTTGQRHPCSASQRGERGGMRPRGVDLSSPQLTAPMVGEEFLDDLNMTRNLFPNLAPFSHYLRVGFLARGQALAVGHPDVFANQHVPPVLCLLHGVFLAPHLRDEQDRYPTKSAITPLRIRCAGMVTVKEGPFQHDGPLLVWLVRLLLPIVLEALGQQGHERVDTGQLPPAMLMRLMPLL